MQWLLLGVGILVGFAVAWWWLHRTWSARMAPLEQERDAAASRAADAESEVTSVRASLAETQDALSKATADLEAAGTEHERLTAALAEARQKHDDVDKARNAAEIESARLSEDLANQAARVSSATETAASTEAKYSKITEEFVELRRLARQVEIERDAAIRDRETSVAEANARAAQAEASVEGAHEERDRLGAELLRMRERSGDIHALRKEAQAAQREVSDLLDANAEKERHIRRLAAELEALRRPAAAVSTPQKPDLDAAPAMIPADDPLAIPGDEGASVRSVDDDVESQTAEPAEAAEPDDAADPIEEAEPAEAPGSAEPAETTEAPEAVAPAEAVEAPEPAQPADDGESVEVDDLQQIKGIGPKFDQMLRERGISTFRDVASIEDDEALEAYLETFAGRIEREDWRGQATALRAEKADRAG